MKQFVKFSLVGLVVMLLAVMGYLYAKPKVVIRNLTDGVIEEVRIKLPSSGVSVGPIAPGTEELIYFSFQETSGVALLAVDGGGFDTTSAELFYDVTGQMFRKLEFDFHPDGSVNIKTRP